MVDRTRLDSLAAHSRAAGGAAARRLVVGHGDTDAVLLPVRPALAAAARARLALDGGRDQPTPCSRPWPTIRWTSAGRIPAQVREQRLVLEGIAVACGVTAAIHVTGLSHPSSFPWSWVLRARAVACARFAYESVPHHSREGRHSASTRARPLAFYLAQQGMYSIQLEPTPTGSVQFGGTSSSWVLIERDMLDRGSRLGPPA